MPIYEYVCRDCGQELEVIQRFSDAPLVTCDRCSGRLEKKISVSSFHLKGSGWYVTDYARKNSNGNAPAGKNGNGGGAEKTEKTESAGVKAGNETGTGTAKETKSEPKGTASSVA